MKTFASWLVLLAFASNLAYAQKYQLLYSFQGLASGDGAGPFSGLLRDKAGNLYGVTSYGGLNDGGTVYEVSRNGSSWKETVLYSFCQAGACLDGAYPWSTLTMDAKGNLYGTTKVGGNEGSGVVFELSPLEQGAWTEAVIYNFCSDKVDNECLDGSQPLAGVVLDGKGNIYGTTYVGGNDDEGVAYELSPQSGGWAETVLHSFCSDYNGTTCLDGSFPECALVFDEAGNLYGTTASGGTQRGVAAGTLFQLSSGTNGWKETVLANFGYPGGAGALSAPTFDTSGNLYGPLGKGGAQSDGALFQWNHSTAKLREVSFDGSNGQTPIGEVLVSRGRGFFGATAGGGNGTGGYGGVLYQVSTNGKLTNLHSFCEQTDCADGGVPYGNLVEDPQGNLYGVTYQGGAYGYGVVYEMTP